MLDYGPEILRVPGRPAYNIRDFAPLHEAWQVAERSHAGIIVSQHLGSHDYGLLLPRMPRLVSISPFSPDNVRGVKRQQVAIRLRPTYGLSSSGSLEGDHKHHCRSLPYTYAGCRSARGNRSPC